MAAVSIGRLPIQIDMQDSCWCPSFCCLKRAVYINHLYEAEEFDFERSPSFITDRNKSVDRVRELIRRLHEEGYLERQVEVQQPHRHLTQGDVRRINAEIRRNLRRGNSS